jgi:hypothetical protein
LVPFKALRTRANENTTVSFSDDVIIGGKTPKKREICIIYQTFKVGKLFYTTTDNWEPEEFKEENVLH